MKLDWNDIPLLLALADNGNMSQTARLLGLDVSTVSRRVAAAERALGLRLLIREPGGYKLTDAGRVFVSHAEAIYDRVQTMLLDTRAEAEGMTGPVRLTAVDVFFSHWLAPRLPALLQEHPGLQMQLIVANHDVSFARREADLAVRLARPSHDASLRMRKVGELGFAVYGLPDRAAAPREHWSEQPWLAYGEELARLPEMQWLQRIGPKRLVRVSSVATMALACESGVGLALLPCVVGDRIPALTRLEPTPVLYRDLWLLSHRDAGQVARFRYVAQWLARLFAEDAAALRGDVADTR